MPSPFPGMDPYLEGPDLWSDFHASMIVAIRDVLTPLLPDAYSALVDRNVWLHEPDLETRKLLGRPDVAIEHRDDADATSSADIGGIAILAPATVRLPIVRRTGNRFVRIFDRKRRAVVTVVELLSPANKDPNEDRNDYLAKRSQYLASRTNLVEIDLLRSGDRPPYGEPVPPASDYCAVVCGAQEFPVSGFWPFSVRDPLPLIPIPLKPGDAVVMLPLAECFNRAFDGARYDRLIDRTQPPEPPLNEADAIWAAELLSKSTRG